MIILEKSGNQMRTSYEKDISVNWVNVVLAYGVPEIVSLSLVSTYAFVKIECAWHSHGQWTQHYL